jgi:hypothetical protein
MKGKDYVIRDLDPKMYDDIKKRLIDEHKSFKVILHQLIKLWYQGKIKLPK